MCVKAMQLVTDRLCLTNPEWQSKELVGEAELWKTSGILRATKRYTTVDCDCDEQLHQAEDQCFEFIGDRLVASAFLVRSGTVVFICNQLIVPSHNR